jgi:hypothetical protein
VYDDAHARGFSVISFETDKENLMAVIVVASWKDKG